MRTYREEARAPKYSAMERERRFLVDAGQRPDLAAVPDILIEDRYIIGTRLRLRRMTDSLDGSIALKCAKKYEADDPLARPMVNIYLDAAEHALLAALPACALAKRRHHVPTEAGLFAIDVFLRPLAGLELAEIECAADAALRSVLAPQWATREVSYDPFFQGGNLARLHAAELRGRLDAM